MKDPENCEYLSFFEYINGKRDVLSNMLILSRKQHLKKWVKKNNLDNNMAFAVSNSSYLNDKINLKWLKYFDKYTQKK